MFVDSKDESNFAQKLISTDTKVSRLRKAFANNSSNNMTLSDNQLHKIGQPGGFLGGLLGPIVKIGLALMKNALQRLAKSVLIPLGLTKATSATDAYIQKELFSDLVRRGNKNNYIS